MTQTDIPQPRFCTRSLAADAYESDVSTRVNAHSPEPIGNLGAYNRWVFDLLRPHLTGRVLEVGCGAGYITQLPHRVADHVVGIDPMGRFIDRVRLRFTGDDSVNALRYTPQELRPPLHDTQRFDTVVSCNVIEHIEDHVDALERVALHLKPGGKAVIFAPAGPVAFGKLDRELGHRRRYTKASLRKAMEDAGLEWVEARYSNALGLFGWWLNSVVLNKKTVPGDQARWFNLLVPVLSRIEKIIRPPFGQSVVGVARKPLRAVQPVPQPRPVRKAA